ncbi:MAG: tyrosine-type recombinase/integrase [Vulcanimicrobiota bacterium]
MFSLSPHQVRQLLGAVDLRSPFGRRDYLLILFLYQTGLRVGECSGLVVHHVYSQGQAREWLHLPAAICKNGRSRVIPLNALAKSCVEKMIQFNRERGFSVAPAAPFFQHRKHGPLSIRSIQKLIKRYRERADLDLRATPHTLRHSAASGLVASGASIATVQRIMGHRRLASTQIYTHVTMEQLKRDAAAFGG